MSAPHEEIARRVAARLAGEVGPKLPAYVEKVIALGEQPIEAPVYRGVDAAVVIALAGLAVTIAKNAWDVYRDLTKSKAETLTPEEIARVRELLVSKSQAGVRFPEEVPSKLRVALVERTADETIEEAKRIQGKQ